MCVRAHSTDVFVHACVLTPHMAALQLTIQSRDSTAQYAHSQIYI